jgi:1-hydroxy-2-naphthoate dioxygenase
VDIESVREVDDLNTWLLERNLSAHWLHDGRVQEDFKPFLWKWDDIQAGLMKATELVPMDMTGRRTIQLRNPGLRGRMSNTIHMSIQCVMPGEVAEAHRHTAAAIRYVIHGVKGAFTVVDGEPLPMETGDLITTPGWGFHDHYNEGAEPVMWLDVLDSRIVALGKGLGEGYPQAQQPRDKSVGFSEKTQGHVKASWLKSERLTPPAMRYPWADTEAAIQTLRENEVEPDPYDGYHVTYAHPVNGGPTLPTFACELQLLPSRTDTQDHRHISTTIYQAFRGSGVTVVNGERLEWSQGDIFIVPPWSWHHHENASDSDSILFSVDDWPTFKAIDLYREEGKAD